MVSSFQRTGRPRPGHWQGGRGGIVPETGASSKTYQRFWVASRVLMMSLRAGVFLTKMTDFAAMNGIYAIFHQPFPARTTSRLPAPPRGLRRDHLVVRPEAAHGGRSHGTHFKSSARVHRDTAWAPDNSVP